MVQREPSDGIEGYTGEPPVEGACLATYGRLEYVWPLPESRGVEGTVTPDVLWLGTAHVWAGLETG